MLKLCSCPKAVISADPPLCAVVRWAARLFLRKGTTLCKQIDMTAELCRLNKNAPCSPAGGPLPPAHCPKPVSRPLPCPMAPTACASRPGAADHLGLNPSVPATCFPTARPPWPAAGTPPWARPSVRLMGEEAAAQEVAVLLGPGLNTKRSPLCGRDFEYFSEDPFLCGQDGGRLCAGHPERTASPPAPSTSRSTARSCAGWPVGLRCWTSAPCGSCT